MDNEKLKLFYFQVTDLWKKLCEEHNTLFEVTCAEYSLMLASDLDAVDLKVEEKQNIIEKIAYLDTLRTDLIKQINDELSPQDKSIDNVSDLLEFMLNFEAEKKEKHLVRFNDLLIDIIEKIRVQNRNNQIFINKALRSLENIRHEARGEKNYRNYNAKGSTLNPGRI